MDINRGNMNVLFTGYSQSFKDAFTIASNQFPAGLGKITMEIQSGTSIEEFPFLEQMNGMREFNGETRIVDNIASKKLQITAREFEQTVGIPRKDVLDDKFGLYSPMVGQMGAAAANLKGDVVLGALVANDTWIDGKNFFATDRKYGKNNTINNYTSSALTDITFNAAYLAMQSYKGHGDTLLRIRPTHLFVGPKLRTTAWNILNNQFAYNASDKVQIENVNKGLVDLVIVPELIGTYDDYWFLADASQVVKPVLFSNREAPFLTRMDKEDDANVFMQFKFLYGTYARCEAALMMPHLIYGGFVA